MWERGGYIQLSLCIFITKASSLNIICDSTASITTVLNLIVGMFVSIALPTLCSLSLFSLQSSDIYLFHFKRRKHKKVRLKRSY